MTKHSLLAMTLLLALTANAVADSITLENGGLWEGPSFNGQPHGFGKATYPDGSVLIGHSVNGVITGLGKLKYADGTTYEGDFLNGLRHGLGKYTTPTASYRGEFRNNLPTGVGIDVNEQRTYKGDVVASEFTGFGVFQFATGERQVGEFEKGSFEGFGTLKLPSGEQYAGSFKRNERHGQGINFFVDGQIVKGRWRRDRLVRAGEVNIEDELQTLSTREQQLSTKSAAIETVLSEKLAVLNSRVKEYLARAQRPVPDEPVGPPSPAVDKDSEKLYAASSGSGFFVSEDGHLVTNNHVIEQCSSVKVLHKGKLVDALVLARDRTNDIALLRGEFSGTAILPISEENPNLLQDVYAAGFPFGNSVSSSVKVTKGIISSLAGIADNFSNVQIDAALQPGNSGGPIVDNHGNVVAVAVAKLDLETTVERFGVVPENTNFGIKATVVRTLLEANSVPLPQPSNDILDGGELGRRIASGTVYLSCLMTLAQIERARERKVLFKEFD